MSVSKRRGDIVMAQILVAGRHSGQTVPAVIEVAFYHALAVYLWSPSMMNAGREREPIASL
jgi:hypothetical protein